MPTSVTVPVDEALVSIDGSFDLVYAFEAGDLEDPWKRFDAMAPTFASDLAAVRPLLGYWIHMTESGTLRVETP